ncbi:MAG: hypothetical protein WA004_15010 [Saprospiraceae bacterium]
MLRLLPILILLTTAAACGEEAPLTMTWEERSLADSLFQVEVNSLRAEMDSLCNVHFDSLKNYYSDSLWTDRIQDIQKQLERIKLQ